MIPSTVGFLDQDFEIETQPSLTYKMDLDGDSVRGLVDEQDAMKQMIFRTLQTERYQYIIYPWYYGIETLDLYGEPVTWVCPELERRISEALAVDERITGVTDFEFDLTVKGVVHAYFTVNSCRLYFYTIWSFHCSYGIWIDLFYYISITLPFGHMNVISLYIINSKDLDCYTSVY